MPPIIDDRDEHLPKLDMAAAVSAAEGSGGSQTAVLRSAPPSVSFATHGESTSQAASPFRFETAAAKAQEQQQHHHHHHHHHHSGEHHGGGTKNQPPATTVGGETRSAPSSFGTAERAKNIATALYDGEVVPHSDTEEILSVGTGPNVLGSVDAVEVRQIKEWYNVIVVLGVVLLALLLTPIVSMGWLSWPWTSPSTVAPGRLSSAPILSTESSNSQAIADFTDCLQRMTPLLGSQFETQVHCHQKLVNQLLNEAMCSAGLPLIDDGNADFPSGYYTQQQDFYGGNTGLEIARSTRNFGKFFTSMIGGLIGVLVVNFNMPNVVNSLLKHFSIIWVLTSIGGTLSLVLAPYYADSFLHIWVFCTAFYASLTVYSKLAYELGIPRNIATAVSITASSLVALGVHLAL